MAGDADAQHHAGPDPRRVRDTDGLVRELDLLRRRAAYGTAKQRVGLADLARRSDVPRSTVHTYVNGLRLPPADVLDRIVLALGADGAEQAAWAAALERLERPTRPVAPDASSTDAGVGHAAAAARVPRQLPAPPHVFVGRASDLVRLDELGPEGPYRVAVVTGNGGMGKTSLAVHWARRALSRFPDGQLYVDLQGFGPRGPREPADVLARLLRGLGTEPDRVPAGLDERTELFAELTEGRRLLVVLDNARDADQVLPLLTPRQGVVTVVTSRDELSELVLVADALPVPVGPLGEDAVDALVAQALGDRLDDGDAAWLQETMSRCGGMPLALRIVGERWRRGLVGPGGTGAGSPSALLDEVSLGGGSLGVRTTIGWTLDQLPGEVRDVFVRTGALLDPVVDVELVAVAADLSFREARRALEALAAVHLVAPAAGGFSQHDLVAAHARESHEAEREDVRREVDRRVVAHLCGRAQRACEALGWSVPAHECSSTAFPDPDAARRWVEQHLDTLTATALDERTSPPCRWSMAGTLGRYHHFQDPTLEVGEVLRRAATSARSARDHGAVSVLANLLGIVAGMRADHHTAWRQFSVALGRARRLGSSRAADAAQSNVAKVLGQLGRHDEAVANLEALIARGGELEDMTRNSLAEVLLEVGDLDGAEIHARWVLDHQPTPSAVTSLPVAHDTLAQVRARSGDPAGARAVLERASRLPATAETLHEENRLLTEVDVARAEQRWDDAAGLALRALRGSAADVEPSSRCLVLLTLADVDLARGDEEAASVWLAECRLVAAASDLGQWSMLAMLTSARLSAALGDTEAAAAELADLVATTHRLGSTPVRERAHTLALELGLPALPER